MFSNANKDFSLNRQLQGWIKLLEEKRGMGEFRGKWILIVTHHQISIDQEARAQKQLKSHRLILQASEDNAWFYWEHRPRHRFYLNWYPNEGEWINAIIQEVRGSLPYLHTHPKLITYK